MRLAKYTIKKGKHYCSRRLPGLHFGSSMSRRVTLNPSMLYEHLNKDSYDWNKLFGFSFGFMHHNNSVRFVWRPAFNDPGMIEIGAYQYNKGVRAMEVICKLNAKQQIAYDFEIRLQYNKAFYHIDNVDVKTATMAFKKPFSLFGFKLFPYFGGQNKAPKEISIFIR